MSLRGISRATADDRDFVAGILEPDQRDLADARTPVRASREDQKAG